LIFYSFGVRNGGLLDMDCKLLYDGKLLEIHGFCMVHSMLINVPESVDDWKVHALGEILTSEPLEDASSPKFIDCRNSIVATR